jgi:hypothetical protein
MFCLRAWRAERWRVFWTERHPREKADGPADEENQKGDDAAVLAARFRVAGNPTQTPDHHAEVTDYESNSADPG